MLKLTFRLMFFALIAALAACFADCGGKHAPAASLELRSSAIIGGEMAVPKGKSVIVGIVGRDSFGVEVKLDLSQISLKTTDGTVVEVKLLGDAFLVTGLRDWFDSPNVGADAGPPSIYGAEPTATITVSCGDATAALTARVVLNVTGTWRVIIDGRTALELQLDQQSRGILYTGTTGNANGSVDGNAFTLSQQGIILNGTFTSRTEASGTYTGLAKGSWKAQKQP